MASLSASPNYPTWMRWSAVAWLGVWAPAYWHTWGPANFLQLCDIAVILTCLGFWTNSLLLISSQAVSALLIDLVWIIDASWRLVSGRPLLGATEYLFDARYPLWVRLLSLFHVAMPPLLLWALHRTGYDRRGFGLQSLIALAVFVASRFTSPGKNMNFAFTDPFFHRTWGTPATQVAISLLFLIMMIYLPTDWILNEVFRGKREI